MRSFVIFALLAIVLAHPPRLVEVAKEVNAMHTTWVANEAIPTRDYTQFIGALKGKKLPVKNIKVRDDLPTEFDPVKQWPECPSLKEIRDQSTCGSCWAFSATGSLEGGNFVANGKLISLSEQQLVDCDTKSSGCNGGLMDNAFQYVMKKGLCTEEDYPYHAKDEDCKDDKCTAAIQIKGYEDVPEMDGEALKAAVSKAPVSVAVEADSAVFQMYTGGVVDSTACGTSLNHGVLAVGYTDEYWIVKNSWGASWGDKGYIKIAYKATGAGICGINQMNSYPTF